MAQLEKKSGQAYMMLFYFWLGPFCFPNFIPKILFIIPRITIYSNVIDIWIKKIIILNILNSECYTFDVIMMVLPYICHYLQYLLYCRLYTGSNRLV